MIAYPRLRSAWSTFRSDIASQLEAMARRRRDNESNDRRQLLNRLLNRSQQATSDTPTEYRFDDLVVHHPQDGGVTFDHVSETLSVSDVPLTVDDAEVIADAVVEAWRGEADNEVQDIEDELRSAVEQYEDEWEVFATTATLDDLLVALIEDDNRSAVGAAFDASLVRQPFKREREPDELHWLYRSDDPELTDLFNFHSYRTLYQDSDLAVIYPQYDSGRFVEEAFVIGEDDTNAGFFVHPIDVRNLPAQERITRRSIHLTMGFDRNPDPEDADLLDLTPGERIRLQGDLGIERLEDTVDTDRFAEPVETVREELVEGVVDEYTTEAYPEWFHRWFNIELTHQLHRGSRTQVALRPTDRHSPGEAAMELEARFDPEQYLEHASDISSATDPWTLIERDIKSLIEATDFARRAEEERERRINTRLEAPGQLNLPIDNHLVLLAEGVRDQTESGDEEPVSVVVPEETAMHIIHDEHNQVSMRIAPGTYRLFLLERGFQPIP